MASNYTCYARIYLPLDNTGKPLPNADRYYDLAINGGDETFKLDDYSKVKFAAFAYGHNNGTGMMRIFDQKNTFDIFPEPALGCLYKFEASKSAVENFIAVMKSCLSHISGNAVNDNYALYEVKSGPFKTYNAATVNPFYATAYLCDMLGDDSLLKEYKKSNSSADYRPWELFNTYHEYWTFEVLN